MLDEVYRYKMMENEIRINVMQMMIFATGMVIASGDNIHKRLWH